MNSIIGILAFVFMLGCIVVIHEFGHFIVARFFGVHCHEFSIGMGPALYQRQGKQTIFSIRAIPFGGYVMMAGENDGSQDEESDDWLQRVPENERLYKKPAWQQCCILVAGVCMNILLAWILFVGISMHQGYVVEEALPIVAQVVENSPAQQAGLQEGDTIIRASADGETKEISIQSQLLEFIQYHHEDVELTIVRDGKEEVVTLTPALSEQEGYYMIGIVSQSNVREIAWYESFKYGTQNMLDTGSSIFRSLAMLIKGKGLENVSGPVGIYTVTEKAASYGLVSYLSLFAMISLNIGIFNLLPVPALDGGRILILLIEKITRRKLNQQVIQYIILASFALLLALVLYATFNDILRLL